MPVASKDPSAVLDYQFDWTEWLAEGDALAQSEWTAPEGLTVDDSDHTATHARVWLSGGVAGKVYSVVNRVTTLEELVDERTLTVVVENR